MKGMTWQILLPWLKRQDGSEAVLVSPDSIRVSEGRRFQLQIKRKQGESLLAVPMPIPMVIVSLTFKIPDYP